MYLMYDDNVFWYFFSFEKYIKERKFQMYLCIIFMYDNVFRYIFSFKNKLKR
jgi:hypothetical protein